MSTTASPVTSQSEWDQFVAEHPHGGFLQSWRWGELKQRYGWRAIRFGVRHADGLAAGVQVLVRTRRAWPGGPPVGLAYVPRGPLASTQEDASAAVNAAVDAARETGASFVRIEPPDLAPPPDLARQTRRRRPRAPL